MNKLQAYWVYFYFVPKRMFSVYFLYFVITFCLRVSRKFCLRVTYLEVQAKSEANGICKQLNTKIYDSFLHNSESYNFYGFFLSTKNLKYNSYIGLRPFFPSASIRACTFCRINCKLPSSYNTHKLQSPRNT